MNYRGTKGYEQVEKEYAKYKEKEDEPSFK